MAAKPVLALVALCGVGLPARADDMSLPALPTFARSPQLDPQTTNSWSGLVVGSEMFTLSQKGAKGHVGGDGFVGYNHELDNNLVFGVQASAGYAPSLFARGPANGYDFAMTNVNVGYDLIDSETLIDSENGNLRGGDFRRPQDFGKTGGDSDPLRLASHICDDAATDGASDFLAP